MNKFKTITRKLLSLLNIKKGSEKNGLKKI